MTKGPRTPKLIWIDENPDLEIAEEFYERTLSNIDIPVFTVEGNQEFYNKLWEMWKDDNNKDHND